ncbi:MAG: GNAT family N-acetyltransferase [Nocardioidaceae bacterium]
MLIETRRLVLRELTEADRPSLRTILQDAETMAAYEGPFSDAEVDEWLGRMLDRYANDGVGLWAVVLREAGELIGLCGLTRQDLPDESVIEVGYLFNRAHWHRGYATEAAAACRDYAFGELGAERVYAIVRDTNLTSMNVAIRLGMTVRTRFTKHYRSTDMPHLAFAVDRAPTR